MDLETYGLVGVFVAGAIPWFEAIAIVPLAIIAGLDPILVVLIAVAGNATTIFLFAYLSSQIRAFFLKRRLQSGKTGESKKFIKAQEVFDKYGILGMAALGPVLIGTQFAAAISVAAGVKPLRTSILITLGTFLWAAAIAIGFVFFGLAEL